jgi:hypothetical protein
MEHGITVEVLIKGNVGTGKGTLFYQIIGYLLNKGFEVLEEDFSKPKTIRFKVGKKG